MNFKREVVILLQMLIKEALKKHLKSKNLYAEDLIWQKEVYPLYIIVQNNFRYCMQNRLLNRQEILNFKYYLNKCVQKNKYARVKFKNDAHEIYTKLKDTSISKKQMLKLNAYLQPTIDLAYQANSCKQIKHLAVIK